MNGRKKILNNLLTVFQNIVCLQHISTCRRDVKPTSAQTVLLAEIIENYR